MEILDQLPSLEVVIQFITDGFFLGAFAGAIIGTTVWTLLERGTFSIIPLAATALIGIILGLYFEGDAIRALSSREWTEFFNGPISVRAAVFTAVTRIIGWMLIGMILGSIISNWRNAIAGFLIGGIMGTLSGILILVMGTELGFPVDSPITIIIVVIVAVILMVMASFGREQEIR